ncbi:MAG: LapA family protein [Acidimicrobiia bacterium]|nr:LapA family protein [Acidimicrobiia bacterium]
MTDTSESKRGIGFGTIVGGGAALLALIFVVQNTGSGTVQFLFWDFTTATWVWALLLFLLGGVSGYFFHWHRSRSRRQG